MEKIELPNSIKSFVEAWQAKDYALVSCRKDTFHGLTLYRLLMVAQENMFAEDDMRYMAVLDQVLDMRGTTFGKDVFCGTIRDLEELAKRARAFGEKCKQHKEGATA